VKRINFGTVINLQEKFVRYCLKRLPFFDFFEIRMSVCIAVVLLLYHLQSTAFKFRLYFPLCALYVILSLNFSDNFCLNIFIGFDWKRNIIFHSTRLSHPFEAIPWVPLGFINKFIECGSQRITVANSCLFVESINLEFNLVRHRLFTLGKSVCNKLEQYL
jgi:hypothetical protein